MLSQGRMTILAAMTGRMTHILKKHLTRADRPQTIIAGSPDRRIAGSPDRRIAGSPDRRIAGSPDRRRERSRVAALASPSSLPA